jgi:hypothetical protein
MSPRQSGFHQCTHRRHNLGAAEHQPAFGSDLRDFAEDYLVHALEVIGDRIQDQPLNKFGARHGECPHDSIAGIGAFPMSWTGPHQLRWERGW